MKTLIEMTSAHAFRHLTPLAAWAAAASWLVLAVEGVVIRAGLDRSGRPGCRSDLGRDYLLYVWAIVTRV